MMMMGSKEKSFAALLGCSGNCLGPPTRAYSQSAWLRSIPQDLADIVSLFTQNSCRINMNAMMTGGEEKSFTALLGCSGNCLA